MVEKLFAGEHVSLESSMKGISEASLNSSDSGGPSEPSYIVPNMSYLSKSQKKIVEAKVRAIGSEVPIYVAIMKRTSVDVSHNKMLVSFILIHFLFFRVWFLSSLYGICTLKRGYMASKDINSRNQFASTM
jgi:hypothetical protein